MVGFIDKNRAVITFKTFTNVSPDSRVLSTMRANGILKSNANPKTLAELSPSHIRSLATIDRLNRTLIDLGATPNHTETNGLLGRALDATAWKIRDRYVHEKFAPIASRIIAASNLQSAMEALPEDSREDIFKALIGPSNQTYENLATLASITSMVGDTTDNVRLATAFRTAGIFQDNSRIADRSRYDKQDDVAAIIGLAGSIRSQGRSFVDEQKMKQNIRQFELAMFSVKAYFSGQEPREWGLAGSSFITAIILSGVIAFRVSNLAEVGGLTLDWATVMLMLWAELASHYDTMMNRAFMAYGIFKLKGGHGQDHLPQQFGRVKDIPDHEAFLIHNVHAFEESPSVNDMHIQYAIRNLTKRTGMVFWDASNGTYFMFGARGAVEVGHSRLALRGIFESTIEHEFPALENEKQVALAKTLTDINPELDDTEMNHCYFEDLILDGGRDRIGVGERKIRLYAEKLSPILLEASKGDARKLESRMTEWYLYEEGLKLDISPEKAKVLAQRVYAEWLSANRKAEITRRAQKLVETGTTEIDMLAKLISIEFGLDKREAEVFLTAFRDERSDVLAAAYAKAMPFMPLLEKEEGRKILSDMFDFVVKQKYAKEKGANIEAEVPEILRQIVVRVLFVTHEQGLRRRIRADFRDRLTKTLAIRISKKIEQLEQRVYFRVNQAFAGRNNVGIAEFLDAERRVYDELSGEIGAIVEEVAVGNGVPAKDTETLKDAIVSDFFMQNTWTESRSVTLAMANYIVRNHDKPNIIKRDIVRSMNNDEIKAGDIAPNELAQVKPLLTEKDKKTYTLNPDVTDEMIYQLKIGAKLKIALLTARASFYRVAEGDQGFIARIRGIL